MTHKPLLAITMGDPAGIGPEIITKALGRPEVISRARVVVVGDAGVLRAAAAITGVPGNWPVLRVAEALGDQDVSVLDLDNIEIEAVGRSHVSAEAGKAAFEYLQAAAQLALNGRAHAVVTAPLNKEALATAGWVAVGHTELLADFCGIARDRVAMMLASDRLRVVHVSTHVSLRRAIDLATTDRITFRARLGAEAARDILGRAPSVAMAGLNPHAGEHGLFGTEDASEIEPAVAALQAEGWRVEGPIPPDTVFQRAISGEFDLVVAMYHDQGHIPSKLLGLSDTVNVTLGLPIIRTSVDHGTAFDIAGRGIADEANLVAACQVAARMAESRERQTAAARDE